MQYKLALALCAAGILLLFLSAPAYARPFHAQYDHSDPAANAHLASGHSPTAIRVWFTEQIEPDFSHIEVYDSKRQRVDLNDSHPVPHDTYSLTTSLRSHLPDDAYTVVFHNVSADDGHAVTGGFSFVVGGGALPANTASLLPQTQAADTNFNVASVMIRWLNYVGMAALVGALAFFLLVWRPVSFRLPGSIEKIEALMSARLTLISSGSLLLLAVGWLAMLVYQACVVSASTFWQIWTQGSLLALLTESRFGSLWLVRLALLALAALLVLCFRFIRSDALRWIVLLMGLGILATTSLSSHAAANAAYSWFLLPTDLIHLVSTSFWIGGLLAFALALPLLFSSLRPGTGDRTRALAALIPRFTLLALVSVILLLLTGTLQTLFHLHSWDAFFSTMYGRTLLVKIVLFAILLAFGAFHGFRISPHLQFLASSSDPDHGASSVAAGKLQRLFRTSIGNELLVAILLLGVVGGLTSLNPPPPVHAGTPAASIAKAGPLLLQGQAADITYALAINPGRVGPNTFEVQLTSKDGRPLSKVDTVLLRFTMLDMEMGVQDLDLDPVPGKPGHYATDGYALSMHGNWEIDLIIRRTGFSDVKTTLHYVAHP